MNSNSKNFPQISEFILSPLVKVPLEAKTPFTKEKAINFKQPNTNSKLDLKNLFDDCFYNVHLEEEPAPKKDEEFLTLFKAKKTICKPKIFCHNPKLLKTKISKGSETEFLAQTPLNVARTTSSTSIKYVEETKGGPEIPDFEEAAYKTPTMKPKSSTHKQFQISTKTERFLNTPSIFDPHNEINICSMDEMSEFFTKYDILETIGSGNFGKVFKCRSKADGEYYAIKYIDNKGRGPLKAKRTCNEIQNLAKMVSDSPSSRVVRYYESWSEKDGFYIVMEYCSHNLQSRKIKNEPSFGFSEEDILLIMKDITMALADLHNNGIVHLDVKPENILLSRNHCYKLADFGLSKNVLTNSNDEISEGDSRYLPPELLNEYNDCNDLYKADIFSLGATIYELVIGEELPCNGEEWHKIREGKLEKMEKNKRFSESFKKLISSLLSSNPKNRPTAQEIIENEIFLGKKAKNIM